MHKESLRIFNFQAFFNNLEENLTELRTRISGNKNTLDAQIQNLKDENLIPKELETKLTKWRDDCVQ